ncbi:hypothetical protein JNUCC64_31005 [Streptomyces sp. JNUCC 64]
MKHARQASRCPDGHVSGPPGTALELLVHGVGGASARQLLNDPRTVRVTGDDTAAVHRRADDLDAEIRPGPSGRRIQEAYVWSNLTSGGAGRALWLLLLPFMVVNLAHWMRPPGDGRSRAARGYALCVRLAALSLTVLLTAAVCEVVLDLIAWQCAGLGACADRRSWLAFASPGASPGGWWTQPGRRLALAALVPAALAVLLWYLSHRTWRAYESQEPPDVLPAEPVPPAAPTAPAAPASSANPASSRAPASPEAPEALASPEAPASPVAPALHGTPVSPAPPKSPAAGEAPGAPRRRTARTPLARPGFWYGRRLVARLRAAHTAAALLTVAAAVAVPAAGFDHRDGGPLPLAVLGTALLALIAAALTLTTAVVCRRGRSERLLDRGLDGPRVRFLPPLALGLLVLAAGYASWSRPGWRSTGRLPGDLVFGALTLVQWALVLALAVTAHTLHRSAPRSRTVLRGLGGPAVTVLACSLAGVLTGGGAQRAADWLDGAVAPDAGGPFAGPPVLLGWQATALPPLLFLVALVLAWLAVTAVRRTRVEEADVRADYPDERPPGPAAATPGAGPEDDRPPTPEDGARARAIARARAWAGLTDRAPVLVGTFAVASLVFGGGALLGAWTSGGVPVRAAADAPGPVADLVGLAQATGSWLAGAGFLLLVLSARRAYRDPRVRRTVGILWDVGTFWPRAAHPFAPPCYAERAVPDLTWRVHTWTRRNPGRLVLSGHSQGSVLAAAAVWQLAPATRERVSLLTYGSPLERLYGRWFPSCFGPEALAALHRETGRWRNLYRETDPIGGPVLVDGDAGVDRPPLRDPLAYGRTPCHPLPAPILGHSDYQADPAFAEERARLLGRSPSGVPEPRSAGADGPDGAGDPGGAERTDGAAGTGAEGAGAGAPGG